MEELAIILGLAIAPGVTSLEDREIVQYCAEQQSEPYNIELLKSCYLGIKNRKEKRERKEELRELLQINQEG